MKAILVLALCLCISISWAGCAPSRSEPSQPQSPAVSISTVSEDVCAEDGTVIFTKTYPKIQITSAPESIAADLQNRINVLLADAAELEAFAREDYAGQEDWSPYFATIRVTAMRADQAVLSLYWEYSCFSGGNHPTLATQSISYGTANGQPLTLEELLEDGYAPEQLSILVNAALSPISAELYDDYEATVGNLFYNSANGIQNWYLSEDGLCFHFAPYEIAPYAKGVVSATTPYSDLREILKAKYLR